ncbi:MAG TPA: sulfatase-like hydrolase/transferase, partial [Isosphaeraceae bacterium]|nr:sulfatase-like hydrolase/transferase [Isosphaeraceae bacterium]
CQQVRSLPVFLLAAFLAAPALGAERPNIVLVLADDFGYGDLACYGGTMAPTPNLDRMAAEGLRFTRYYTASPICSASRAGLITGHFPARHQITSYLQTRKGNRACGQADFLDPKAPALPRALKQAGYRTAHIGKWHLGGGRDVDNAPPFSAYGYDLGLGTWESPEPAPELTARDWIWSAVDEVKRWDRTRWMVDQTLEFLKSHPDDPCFVNLWLDDSHTPWVPSADDQVVLENGRARGKKDTPKRLRGVLVEMDRQVGRLLEAIRSNPGDRPTIVLFLADNGPLPTFEHKRTRGFRGSKLSLYEGGVHVPFIAWCPGLIPEGKTNDATVLAAVDLFPTLCQIAGASLPEGYKPDGEDMTSALLGKSPMRTTPLYWEYGRNDDSFGYPKGADRSPNVAVLDGPWKLLVNSEGGGVELYNITTDPVEQQNRVEEESDLTRQLKDSAIGWRKAQP